MIKLNNNNKNDNNDKKNDKATVFNMAYLH